MTDSIRRRGPDSEGYWYDPENPELVLGHRRLSILDLSEAGAQPMSSRCGRFVMSYNGEIYNAPLIRKRLLEEIPDLRLRGHSDTEILLESFSHFGVEQTLGLIKGMFAVALWDRHKGSLTLIRDHLGKKPLYVGRVGQGVVFASELKPIQIFAKICGYSLTVNRTALTEFSRFGFVPSYHSIYDGVFKLKPGHLLTIADFEDLSSGFTDKMQPYWQIEDCIHQKREDGLTLKDVLSKAVSCRMMSDVPLGAFLSGGIDSSLVTALMQEQSGKPVQTYSIGFEDTQFDESIHAEAVARALGTDHKTYTVTARDSLDTVPLLPEIYDEPFADYSQIPTTILCQKARQDTTVALSGDGGDEVFCGYRRYFMLLKLWEKTGFIPRPVKNILASMLAHPSQRFYNHVGLNGKRLHSVAGYLRQDDFFAATLRTLNVNPDIEGLVVGASNDTGRQQNLPGLSKLENMMLIDTGLYLPDDILVKVDRASMYSSLEVRSPLLDIDVVSYAWSLPIEDKIFSGRNRGKRPLYDLLCRYIPQELIDRPKQGFTPPVAEWLRGPLKDWAEDLLGEDSIKSAGFYHFKTVQRLWREFQDQRADHHSALWAILMAQSWYQRYKDFH